MLSGRNLFGRTYDLGRRLRWFNDRLRSYNGFICFFFLLLLCRIGPRRLCGSVRGAFRRAVRGEHHSLHVARIINRAYQNVVIMRSGQQGIQHFTGCARTKLTKNAFSIRMATLDMRSGKPSDSIQDVVQ